MNVSNRPCLALALASLCIAQFNKVFSAKHRFINCVLTLLILFIVCLSFNNTQAQKQTLTIPLNGRLTHTMLLNCDSTSSFISDTANHTLYTDITPRSDTLSICPQNQRQRVLVNFLDFDLAVGDSLFAYDGKIPSALNLSEKSSGVGRSNAFGGWFNANCSPDTNATGCVSFIFKTNGDNLASAGFRADVKCEDRIFQIQKPTIASSTSTCNQSYKVITIPAATVSSSCVNTFNDTTYVRIKNSAGIVCKDTCLSMQGNMSFTAPFAFGSYAVEYKLKIDTTVTQTAYFSLQPRALVCNDTLNVGMDGQCNTWITPDMLLEASCDTIPDTLYYEIKITVPNGKPGGRLIAQGSGRGGDYPIINKDLVDFCGGVIYTAEIKRTYYDGLNLSFCNDGPQTNTCWTLLRFEDKIAPQFTTPARCDTIYACNIDMTPEAFGLTPPTVFENCDSNSVRYVGVEMLSIPTQCDTLNTYLAIWEASDACGNKNIIKDTVKVFRPGLDKIITPTNQFLSCGVDATDAIYDFSRMGEPSIQIGYQRNGIFTATDTLSLTQEASVCNYNLEYRDVHVGTACNNKYYRYWTLLDWCAQSTVPLTIDTQLLEFIDTLAPIINCSGFTSLATAELIDLPSATCQMPIDFPLPSASDKCVENPMVEVFTVDVLERSGWWSIGTTLAEVGELECDTFRVGYRAYDDCHQEQLKEDTCYRYFIIRDLSAPTAICEDHLNISLSSDSVFLNADALDGGSWDMCEVDTILARRTVCGDISTYQGPTNTYLAEKLGSNFDAKGWSDLLYFTCCDVHQPIFAELLVIDHKGNYNICIIEIKAEDKREPICQPLPPKMAYCDEYNDNQLGPTTDHNNNDSFDQNEWIPLMDDLVLFYNEEFGDPASVCEDNLTCNELMMEQEYQLVRLSCGETIIKRRYRGIDDGRNNSEWVEQVINLKYRANWEITFPSDYQSGCDGDFDIPAASPIQNGNCDQLSWDYEDEIFEGPNDVFVKILRTYSIVNWCIYQPGESPLIVTRNENHQKFVVDSFMVSSDSLADVGFIQYTQVLKVVDNEKPFLVLGKVDTILVGKGDAAPAGEEDQVLGAAPFECDAIRVFQVFARDCSEANSESLTYGWNFLMDGDLVATGTGDNFSQIVYPGPLYEVNWTVIDPFSNTSYIDESYTFIDGLAPTAYCNGGIVAEYTRDNRFVTIHAEMFDRGSYDNCTDQSNLIKKLWHPVLNIPKPETTAEVLALPDFLELGCLFLGTQDVSFYVMDEDGNFSSCIAKVVIQNNMLSCSRRRIAGEIMDFKGQPIEAVEVDVVSTDANLSILSNGNGGYEFTMPDGADYTIRPIKDNDPLNGVSTYDLVLISQHILGLNTFDTPYKYIAADVNKSGTITAFDLVQLRQLILNVIQTLPNNTSWRFVDMDHEFVDETAGMELEDINEEKNIRDLSGDRLGMDFLGVKIGDINGSAVPNRSLVSSESRTNKTAFVITTDNQQLKKGEIYTVPFNVADLTQITGYQFTLTFNYLKLLHIEGGVANLEHFGRTLEDRGILTTSWHTLESRETTTPLFSLTFQATKDGQLEELLKITSDHTPAEAYSFSGNFHDVALNFSDPSPILFQVYQNTPNPFNHHTTIAFDLPAKGNVVYQLVNSQGQIVQKRAESYQKGTNMMSIDMKHLPEGTYYYQLSTPFGVTTKKMTKVQ